MSQTENPRGGRSHCRRQSRTLVTAMLLALGALTGCWDEPMSPTAPSAVGDGSVAQASEDPGRGQAEPQSRQSATSDVSSGPTVGGLSVSAAAQGSCAAASSPTNVEATIGTRGTVRLDWTHDHDAGEYVHNRSSSGVVCRRARVAGFNVEWQRTDSSGFGASSGDPTVARTGTYAGVPGRLQYSLRRTTRISSTQAIWWQAHGTAWSSYRGSPRSTATTTTRSITPDTTTSPGQSSIISTTTSTGRTSPRTTVHRTRHG